jgi:hypothetical protein
MSARNVVARDDGAEDGVSVYVDMARLRLTAKRPHHSLFLLFTIMPEHDFELYLSLLSRFLRLKPAQHAEIADELRDHLEQRLEELASKGLSHDEAIRQALDEFGDAAELANHFTRVAHIRRRRLIMRCTLGTIGTVAAALLIATAFWPETAQSPLPSRGVAHEGVDSPRNENGAVAASNTPSGRAEVEAKLKKRLDHVSMDQVELHSATEFFGEQTGLDILIDKPALADEGIKFDSPVTLKIERTAVEAGLALKLILEPLQLGYTIRDNIVVISTAQKLADLLEIRVYNVRDLLVGGADEKLVSQAAVKSGRAGLASIPSLLPVAAAQIGQGFGGGANKGSDAQTGSSQDAAFVEVVVDNVEPETWNEVGGSGSASVYNGLLVVRQTDAVHAKIVELLELMRQSLREGVPTRKAVVGRERPAN